MIRIYLAVFYLVLCFSCRNDFNQSQKYPIKQTHTHEHAHDHSHEHGDHGEHSHEAHVHSKVNIDPNKNSGIYGSENRDTWQRPDLIINHLGNLEGKVLADIGAGPTGYFSFVIGSNTNVKKVLALDIDQSALEFMEKVIDRNKETLEGKIETRLVSSNDPKLKTEEVNVILISSTLTFIDDRVAYLKNLRKSMPTGGRLVIVDYKMKEIPEMFPPVEQRIPLYQMEQIVDDAGFKRIVTDDTSLQFQYVVVALNP